MKFFNKTLFVFLFSMFVLSCSSDDNASVEEEMVEQPETPETPEEPETPETPEEPTDPNAAEDRMIPLQELESGLVIEAAVKRTGTPPTPTNNLDFKINTAKQEAFLTNGFNISFSSDDDVTGAYILVQDTEGNASNSYFEVPLTDNQTLKSKRVKTTHSRKQELSQKRVDDDFTIDIDFNSTIQPGQFCYEICLFDANGNISSIQKICVEVEAWGGNTAIVGEWLNISTSTNGEDITTSSTSIRCDNGEDITVLYPESDWVLTLKANGDYEETYTATSNSIDFEASRASCSPQYDTIAVNETYSGKWAYNEEKQTLTIIDFAYVNNLNSSENSTFPNGSVYFDGNATKASVTNNQLTIVETFIEGNETFNDITVFNRK